MPGVLQEPLYIVLTIYPSSAAGRDVEPLNMGAEVRSLQQCPHETKQVWASVCGKVMVQNRLGDRVQVSACST